MTCGCFVNCLHSNMKVLFQNNGLMARHSEPACNSEADDASTNDSRFALK